MNSFKQILSDKSDLRAHPGQTKVDANPTEVWSPKKTVSRSTSKFTYPSFILGILNARDLKTINSRRHWNRYTENQNDSPDALIMEVYISMIPF